MSDLQFREQICVLKRNEQGVKVYGQVKPKRMVAGKTYGSSGYLQGLGTSGNEIRA